MSAYLKIDSDWNSEIVKIVEALERLGYKVVKIEETGDLWAPLPVKLDFQIVRDSSGVPS